MTKEIIKYFKSEIRVLEKRMWMELWSLFLLTTKELTWQKTFWMKLLMENIVLLSNFLTLNLCFAEDYLLIDFFFFNILSIFMLWHFEFQNNLLAESYRFLCPVASTVCGYGFPQISLFSKYIVYFQICSELVGFLGYV